MLNNSVLFLSFKYEILLEASFARGWEFKSEHVQYGI